MPLIIAGLPPQQQDNDSAQDEQAEQELEPSRSSLWLASVALCKSNSVCNSVCSAHASDRFQLHLVLLDSDAKRKKWHQKLQTSAVVVNHDSPALLWAAARHGCCCCITMAGSFNPKKHTSFTDGCLCLLNCCACGFKRLLLLLLHILDPKHTL
jgi:hypothetical protein